MKIDDETIAIGSKGFIYFFDFRGDASAKYPSIEIYNGWVKFMAITDESTLLFTTDIGRIYKISLDDPESWWLDSITGYIQCTNNDIITGMIPGASLLGTLTDIPYTDGIATTPNSHNFLFVEREGNNIFKCSSEEFNSCEKWADFTADASILYWDLRATAIHNDVVFVTDSYYDLI